MAHVEPAASVRERRQEIRKEMKRLRGEMADEKRQRLDRAILSQLLDPRNGALSAAEKSAAGSGFFREALVGSGDTTSHACLPVIYCYASCHGEADTRAFLNLLWERRIPVALPRVEGRIIRFYQVHGENELKPGYMEIAEPGPDCPPVSGRPGPVITPGLAFGRDGSRIGYGGGYYDRFFAREPDHPRIAIAYPFQVLEALPCEAWDRRMDRILTGEAVIPGSSLCAHE